MRAFSRAICATLAVLAISVSGCRRNWMVPAPVYQNQLQAAQQQHMSSLAQQQQLQSRVSSLDRVNDEKERQLASSRQEVMRLQNHLAQVNERLRTTATELAQARDAKAAAEEQAQRALAATQARGGAVITANNSLNKAIPQFNIPGVTAAQDGDVVRVQIAAANLFAADGAVIQGGGAATLNQVAAELARTYPNQIVGIEGHTDDSPRAAGGPWQSNHHLSTARAMAVYNHLSGTGTLRSEQLHVAGHGSNHPRYSNSSASARTANQRIELVVYPEQMRTARR